MEVFMKKLFFFSLSLIILILSFDCWFKNLPISGYALITIILILIGCTTWSVCHGIKWLLHCNKPLKFYFLEKIKNEILKKILNIFNNTEDALFDKIFYNETDSFRFFNYPTTLDEQVRLLLKDIEEDFVKPWYSEISQNPSFLFDTHLLLEEILFKVIEKLKTVNYKNLILSILMLYLNHLQEYIKSTKKLTKANNLCNFIEKHIENHEASNYDGVNVDVSVKNKLELVDVYRFIHPGSQSDQVLNYYLKKVIKLILQEYAPQEFFISLQCKILTSILARKVLRRCLTTVEDPNWIYIKIIALLDSSKYNELLQNKVYSVKEKVLEKVDEVEEYQFRKSAMIDRYIKSNLLNKASNKNEKTDFNSENTVKCNKCEESVKKIKSTKKNLLNLPLQHDIFLNGEQSHISSVLGGIISSTAGPLLPDNMSVCYQPLNKMWQSPDNENWKDFAEEVAVPLGKTISEAKMENKQCGKGKRLSRSKSTDVISPISEINEQLKVKDISIGEELCENVRFTSNEDLRLSDCEDRATDRKQIGNTKRLMKTRSCDSGSFAAENVFDDSDSETDTNNRSGGASLDGKDKKIGNVSPVYEEPEDFATTIAKLRNLLHQRESTSTVSDKSIYSLDSQSNNTSFAEASSTSSKTQSTDLENSSFDSQASSDIHTDGRLFTNICIPKTEVVTDSNGSSYVLYCVQYDGIYVIKDQNNPEEHELLLQTTIVKRRFQEFLNLQNSLEECSYLKSAMKGIKGPSKWLNLPFSGKREESVVSSRKPVLELYLQQLCSKVEICTAPELHEFLDYGINGAKGLKKDSDCSSRRINKLLTNKVTDIFNTIKTALPSFDFDSPAAVITNDNLKGSQDQKLLPGFLNFGSKNEEFEINFKYTFKEPTGESLTDNIRRYLNEKSDCVEDGLDVLDSNDWLAEKRECRLVSSEGKCVWHGFKNHLDDDPDSLDSWLPVYSVILDIFCELLQQSDSWATKEPVIRLIKVLTGHWELKIQERLSKWDWDQILGNIIRLLRSVIFQSISQPASASETIELNTEQIKLTLKEIIIDIIPKFFLQLVKSVEISSAITLFIDSFQNFRTNRDVLLRLLDILLVQLLSCHHLASDIT